MIAPGAEPSHSAGVAPEAQPSPSAGAPASAIPGPPTQKISYYPAMKGFRVDETYYGTGVSTWPWQHNEKNPNRWNKDFAPPRRDDLPGWMYTANQRSAAEAEQRRTGVYPEDAPPKTTSVGGVKEPMYFSPSAVVVGALGMARRG